MTVRLTGDAAIVLEGVCTVEDTEPLVGHLLSAPHATVDWRLCEEAHTAIIQILIASGAALLGTPCGSFLRDHVAPLIVETRINSRDHS